MFCLRKFVRVCFYKLFFDHFLDMCSLWWSASKEIIGLDTVDTSNSSTRRLEAPLVVVTIKTRSEEEAAQTATDMDVTRHQFANAKHSKNGNRTRTNGFRGTNLLEPFGKERFPASRML